MIKDLKSTYDIIGKYIIKVSIAGLVIGQLYTYEYLIAVLLILRVIYRIYKLKVEKEDIRIPIIGMLITGFIGTVIEYYGTKYSYWDYHDISGQLPKYLFFVWMLAFNFMYNLEKKMFIRINPKTALKKFNIILFVVVFYPTIGEMITITQGVWTYHFPYKLFGVTPHTISAIAFVHIVINYGMTLICRKMKIKDIIFNPA